MFHFFFDDTPSTEIYALSLHDALPISGVARFSVEVRTVDAGDEADGRGAPNLDGEAPRVARDWFRQVRDGDRKSTRLNSSHANISYAAFCLKKKTVMTIVVLSSLICYF